MPLPAPALSTTETIPALTHDGYLPPFCGGPTDSKGRAPYLTTIEEFVTKFGFSKLRREMLDGLITVRRRYYLAGIRCGFQWINGSFVANTKPEPGDIDLVTLFVNPYKTQEELLEKLAERELHPMMRGTLKDKFHCDSYQVDLSYGGPHYIIPQTLYWYDIFSHTREKLWKGIVQIPLPSTATEAIFEHRLPDLMGGSHE